MTNRTLTPEQALQKAMPLLCRATIEGPAPVLKATTGEVVTAAMRDELLAKCVAGEFVELDLTLLAYEQRAGVANRNYVRFRDGAMSKLGASGRGKPFLRDHNQFDVMSRAGRITKSGTEKTAEGGYELRMTTRLTAPWAVELALRDLLDSVSIGWLPTGPVECSACAAPIFTKCYHFPGDKLAEVTEDGKKKLVRDRAGAVTVEWVYTEAELIECSVCNVPGVPSAGIDEIRAALAAGFPDGDAFERPDDVTPIQDPAEVDALSARQDTLAATPEEHPMPEPKNETPTTEQTAADEARIAARVRKLRADERELQAVITKHKLSLDAGKMLDEHKTVEAAKLAVLDTLTQEHNEQAPVRPEHTASISTDERDKRLELYRGAIQARMSGKAAKDPEQRRLASLSAMEIAEEIAEEAGIPHREIRKYTGEERARLLMGQRQPSTVLSGGGRISTSDFPLLVGAAGTDMVQRQFAEKPQLWKRLGREENLPNFERQYKYGGGRFPSLKAVPQGGVYQRGSFVESSEYKRLGKAGRMLSLTWELMLADKLGEFARVIADYGRAARRYETRQFYSKLIGTAGAGTMYDGSDLFSVANANISGTTGTPSVSVLDAAMQKMALQRDRPGDPAAIDEDDREGDELELEARFWLLPVVHSTAASQLLGTAFVPTAATGAVTDEMKALNIIRGARLDRESTKRSYLFSDPNDVAAFEYGYLTTEPGPALIREEGFTVDGVDFKCRFTNYLEFVEHRGVVRIDPA